MTTKRFTGQYHESSIPGGEGLYYYNARWYDAKLGRFVSADSIVPDAGNPQSFNRYSYVYNNPLRYTDPTGHCIFGLDTLVCVAVVLAGAALFLQGDDTNHQPTQEEINSQRLGGALLFGGAAALAMGGGVVEAGAAACADGDCTNELRGLAPVKEAISSAAEDGMQIYMRGRPNVPRWIERMLPAKAESEKTLEFGRFKAEFPGGIRITNRWRPVYSDVDLAYIMQDGKVVTDKVVIQRVVDSINRAYGSNVIQHHDHFNGMREGASGATMTKFLKGSFYVFDQSGYLGTVQAIPSITQKFLEMLR